MIKALIGSYLLTSLAICIHDIYHLYKERDKLLDVPVDEIMFYEPDPVLGKHNLIFFPSLLFMTAAFFLLNIVFNIINGY